MITLTKQGSSLIVTSDDINVFPFKDGTISLPMNSLYIIIDESNYVSFKQVNDNNQLFGTEIGKLTINGTLATKENIIQLFDSVANSVSTGGGGEGGAVSSVNGQTGAVIITPQNIGAYSTSEADAKFATINSLDSKQDELVSGTNIKTINNESILGEGNIEITVDTSNLLTKSEASDTYQVKGDYALKSEIPSLDGYATEAFVNEQISTESTERQKQDTALGGMIAAETEARKEAISALTETVNSKADTSDLSDYLLKTDAESTYAKESEITNLNNVKLDKSVYETDKPTFALKTEIPDTSNFITNEELEGKDYATESQLSSKQDTLVSGQNIKTINSQSLLGEGNIEITVEGGGISDAPNDNKLYGRKNEQWSEIIIPTDYATNEELNTKQDTLVSGTNIKTINSQSILGEGDLVINGNNEYDFNQIKTESEYRNNFITNAKCGDIIKSISDSNITDITDVDYAIIICIDGNNYSLIVNNIANPFLLNFNVSVDEAVISDYLKLWVNVDAEINNTSTNPVENKVIYNELSNKLNKITIDLDDNNGGAVNPTNLISHIPNALTVGTATVLYSQLTKALISYIGTDNKVYLATLNSNRQEDSTYKWEIENIYEIGNNSGGGIEYTAGSGITISDENVISLDYNVFDFSGNTSNNITVDGIYEKIKTGDILKNVVYSPFNLKADFLVISVVTTEVIYDKKNVVCLFNSSSINSNSDLQFLILRISDDDNVYILKYSSIDTKKLKELKEEWFGTTEEYNAIVTKDENTLYYITDDVTE